MTTLPAHARRPVTVFEVLATGPQRCNLGCEHKRAQVVRRHTLTIVETREVQNLWTAAYGRPQSGTGYRAVDTAGVEWRSDWDAVRGDGPSRIWTTQDGRRAEQGGGPYPTYDRPRAYDGYIEVDADGVPVPTEVPAPVLPVAPKQPADPWWGDGRA